MRRVFAIAIIAVLLITAVSCDRGSEIRMTENGIVGEITTAPVPETEAPENDGKQTVIAQTGEVKEEDLAEATLITLSDGNCTVTGAGATAVGSVVTVFSSGTYLVRGSVSDGMILVDASDDEKVILLLDGASIRSATSAAIYVKNADKTILETTEGSVNVLTNGGRFAAIDESNIDAVIFAKDDLTLKGSGSITITSPAGHGVVTKNDLKITGGTYSVYAASQGFSGKDSIKITGGAFSVTAGKDGFHSENEEDAAKGNIEISGGNFSVTATGDGISASGTLTVAGGSFNLVTGGGAAKVQKNTDTSAKGLKATGDLTVSGGLLYLDCADDAVHGNANVTVDGGELNIKTGDDGVHADETATVNGGVIVITASYEGLEGQNVTITGGAVSIVASDDGINAAGGNDNSGAGGFRGGDRFGPGDPRGGGMGGMQESSGNSLITITGGTILVNAKGDGIDANGSIEMTGGVLYVSGPTDNGNGALDYDQSATISGGILIAAGSTGMAQNFSAGDQGSVLVSTGTQKAGTTITLSDSDGNVLATFTPEKSYQCAVISVPGMQKGSSYTLTLGSQKQTLTLSTLHNSSGGTRGGQGFFGF